MNTLRHKVAFLKVEKKLRGRITWRGLLHDAEKPFLYLLPWMSEKEVQQFHRKHNRHGL